MAAAEEAKKRQVEAQKAAEREKEAKVRELERQEQLAARRAEAAKPKIITVHELTSEETLSHLSLKYYGHATKPYWMVIYEANKDVVGDNPNLVHRGMMIKIPELPPELQEKE
ncbi:LysM peptidoglycan-binding domain-containing protein [Chloroflexota bacterium]